MTTDDPYWTIDGWDAYDILAVQNAASIDEIQRAYQRRFRDPGPATGGPTVRQARLDRAYRTLSDPQRRVEYDRARRSVRGLPKWVRLATIAGGYLVVAVAATVVVADQAGSSTEPSWATYAYLANQAGWAHLVDWHAGLLIALVWVTFLLGGVVIVVHIDPFAPLSRALALRLGVGLILGLLAFPAAAMWLSSLSVGHAGITVIVWLATVTAGCGYLLIAYVFLEDVGEAKTGWAFGVVPLVVLAGFVASTAWVGELTDWHSGIIFAMWLGELSAVFAYVYTAVGRLDRAQPRRLGRVALSSSLVPLGSFSLGVAATIYLGTGSDPDLRIILAFWVVLSLATVIYSMVREELAQDSQAESS